MGIDHGQPYGSCDPGGHCSECDLCFETHHDEETYCITAGRQDAPCSSPADFHFEFTEGTCHTLNREGVKVRRQHPYTGHAYHPAGEITLEDREAAAELGIEIEK